jgi:RNA polymerase sigma factor (sigma-70 family)
VSRAPSSARRGAAPLDDPDDRPEGEAPEPEPEPPLTAEQERRVRASPPLVKRAAARVARRFKRFVEPPQLWAIGTLEMYRAVRAFKPEFNHEFEDYAERRMRWAMVKAIGEELFQDRIRRCVDIASDQYWAYVADPSYDASKHDDEEARRRFRAIANGMLAGAFMAGVEEAQRATPEGDAADREEYEVAVQALRAALQQLSEPHHSLLVLLYRDLRTTEEASVALHLSVSTVKRYHAEGLVRLRQNLGEQGVTEAPAPRGQPDPGGNVLAFRPRGAPSPPRKKPGR